MQSRNYFGFRDWHDIGMFFSADVGDEPDLIYAIYNTPSYEGHATVIFSRNGRWSMVSGSHCSCYGLEGQWEEQKIDPNDHLKAREQNKTYLLAYDTVGQYPEATPEAFESWLNWAIQQPTTEMG